MSFIFECLSVKLLLAKKKFNQNVFNYEVFSKNIVKLFTDALHGLPISIKTKSDAIQLISFLFYDGALVWNKSSDKIQIKSSQFEDKLYTRCKNFLFGLSDDEEGSTSASDGPDVLLTDMGYAACLFYFLSFQKPELTQIIFEISKKTDLNACHTAYVNWSLKEAFAPPDDKLAESIKQFLDDFWPHGVKCRGLEYWMHVQMRKIRKIFNEIHTLAGNDDMKMDEIENLLSPLPAIN